MIHIKMVIILNYNYASRCFYNKYKDIFKKKSFNKKPLDLQIKDDLCLFDIIQSKEEKILEC